MNKDRYYDVTHVKHCHIFDSPSFDSERKYPEGHPISSFRLMEFDEDINSFRCTDQLTVAGPLTNLIRLEEIEKYGIAQTRKKYGL